MVVSAPPGPTSLPPDDELWDVRAAARYLKRSVSWVYHKAEDGTLPVRRLGGWGIRPKITERRYGHLLPEFMSSEVNRLQFGMAVLAPSGGASQAFAGFGRPTVTPGLQSATPPRGEAGTPSVPERFRPHLWRGVRDSKVLERSDPTCRRGTTFVRKSLRDGAFASAAE
jgi:hypothetical protein